jgi:hypothetical protein
LIFFDDRKLGWHKSQNRSASTMHSTSRNASSRPTARLHRFFELCPLSPPEKFYAVLVNNTAQFIQRNDYMASTIIVGYGNYLGASAGGY